jgi:hypothetical protein
MISFCLPVESQALEAQWDLAFVLTPSLMSPVISAQLVDQILQNLSLSLSKKKYIETKGIIMISGGTCMHFIVLL